MQNAFYFSESWLREWFVALADLILFLDVVTSQRKKHTKGDTHFLPSKQYSSKKNYPSKKKKKIDMPRRFLLEDLPFTLLQQKGRHHVRLDQRFITIVFHRGSLYALDSPCYHASGPLGEGPIVDMEEIPCIRCPWHQFLVALDTGEEVTRDVKAPVFDSDGVFRTPTYPMEPLGEEHFQGPPKRGRRVQRMHKVWVNEEKGGLIEVEMEDAEEMRRRPLPSDTSATHDQRGAMSMQIRDIKEKDFA